MFKRVTVAVLLSCILPSIAIANDDDKTYVFKAKGKFAEELKALMKKHAKDGEVEITEEQPDYYGSSRKKSNGSVIESFLNSEDLSGDLSYGKEIYDKKCHRCHGKQAEKNTYATSRVLNTLSKEDLYYGLRSYKTDSSYGKSTKVIMREQVYGMTTEEMVSVSAYIYSLKHSKSKALKALNEAEEDKIEKKQGVQGTYLK